MYFVYIIENKEKAKKYTGQTSDLNKRLARHNNDLPNKSSSFSSKNKGKWEYIYIEEFETRQQAIIRERELKTGKGREYLKKMIDSR